MPKDLPRELRLAKEFTVTDQHLKLLGRMFIGYDAWTEFGAPEVDPKRPYGNSDVYCDIAEILGIVPAAIDSYGDPAFDQIQLADMLRLHQEMTLVLQILVSNNGVSPGKYLRTKQYDDTSWRPEPVELETAPAQSDPRTPDAILDDLRLALTGQADIDALGLVHEIIGDARSSTELALHGRFADPEDRERIAAALIEVDDYVGNHYGEL